MSNKKAAKAKEPDAVWRTSGGKALLSKWLKDEVLPDSMQPTDVYIMSTEFKKFKYANFVTNLWTLPKSVRQQNLSAAFDQNALANDQRLFPTPSIMDWGYLRWQGSEAERLLKSNVNSKNERMAPQKLHYESQPEYQLFTSKLFREHLYQEVHSRREKSYWLYKKKQQK
jgi:hypothetical protein